MPNLCRCAVGVVAVLAVGGLASAQTSTPAVAQMTDPTIYIGPPVRDGFIDTNNAIADSIKDIKNVFRQRIKQVRIVDAPEAALLHLYVIGRGKGGSRGMVGIPVGTTTMLLNVEELYVNTLLRVGDYEKSIVGVDGGQWRDCAGQVVNQLKAWLAENDAKVVEARALRDGSWLAASTPAGKHTRQNLTLADHLQPGQSLDDVLAVMGEPVLREFRGAVDEWHYCSTGTAPVGSTPADSFVALFFRDKELVEMSKYTVTLKDTNGATGSCSLFTKRGSYRFPAWAMQPE